MGGIAIVGMDVRFPGASSLCQLWQMLAEGRVGVTKQCRWADEIVDPYMVEAGTMVSDQLGQIEGVELFEEGLFSISPAEADALDPQQRLLLQSTWRALEHGCQTPLMLSKARVGVWVAAGASDYQTLVGRSPGCMTAFTPMGVSISMLASRISRHFDLRGPSIVVAAGCCSVAAAVEQACRALRLDEVDLAVVGGVNIILDPARSIALSQSWMLSPKGECRPFDSRADGYVRSEGLGVAVLKRAEVAAADGDPILAVIRGVCVSHSGKAEQGDERALVAVIRTALDASELAPADIDYVEAYGIGAPAVDRAELRALAAVFKHVSLGSAKANVGSLEWASGLVAIAKLTEMFRVAQAPPQLHLDRPVAECDPSVFHVARELEPFQGHYALVNAMSMGGLCAAMILEAPPEREARLGNREPHLIAISAPDHRRLESLVTAWADAPVDVADAAWTLATRRRQFPARSALIVDELRTIAPKLVGAASTVVWAFSGQGSQRLGMGIELAKRCPEFAGALAEVGAELSESLAIGIEELLTHSELENTRFSQPALFALQYALAETLARWGLRPTVVAGHSVGEIAASVTAKILTLKEAAAFVVVRGGLMSALPAGGGMLAAFAGIEDVTPFLERGVTIAALNGPARVTVAGPKEALDAVAGRLWDAGIATSVLKVSHAFHSALMDPILGRIDEVTRSIPIRATEIVMHSTVLAQSVTSLPQGYWARHAREPVRFDSVISMIKPGAIVVEIGPGAALSSMGRVARTDVRWVPMLGVKDEWRGVLEAVATLWSSGAAVDLAAVEGGRGGRAVHGPTMPFLPVAHWLVPDARVAALAEASTRRDSD